MTMKHITFLFLIVIGFVTDSQSTLAENVTSTDPLELPTVSIGDFRLPIINKNSSITKEEKTLLLKGLFQFVNEMHVNESSSLDYLMNEYPMCVDLTINGIDVDEAIHGNFSAEAKRLYRCAFAFIALHLTKNQSIAYAGLNEMSRNTKIKGFFLNQFDEFDGEFAYLIPQAEPTNANNSLSPLSPGTTGQDDPTITTSDFDGEKNDNTTHWVIYGSIAICICLVGLIVLYRKSDRMYSMNRI